MSKHDHVSSYMTAHPHSIGREQTLAAAHKLMQTHRIRHLPVLEGGRLVGIVTQRDLHLVETLPDVDPATVPVDDAMTDEVYVVTPQSNLAAVVTHMAEHRLGSAVVMEKDRVVGIFTAVDGLKVLADKLSE